MDLVGETQPEGAPQAPPEVDDLVQVRLPPELVDDDASLDVIPS